jgi:hypothetical protein
VKVPKRIIRLRLTDTLGAAFIAAAGLLLVLNDARVVNAMNGSVERARESAAEVVSFPATGGGENGIDNVREAFTFASEQQAAETLSAERNQSTVALVILTAPLLLLGWVEAGSLLQPIHQISSAAQRIRHTNLRSTRITRTPDPAHHDSHGRRCHLR